jgi:hypothetical protein
VKRSITFLKKKKREEFSLEKIVLKRLTERRERKNKMREMSKDKNIQFKMREEYGQNVVYKKKMVGMNLNLKFKSKVNKVWEF